MVAPSQTPSHRTNQFSILQRPSSLILAVQALFLLNTVIWVLLGIITLVKMANGIGGQVGWILAILMFGNAAMMLFLGWGSRRWPKWLWIPALGFLGLNILLTITDQFGLIDLATMLIDLALAALIIAGRLAEKKV